MLSGPRNGTVGMLSGLRNESVDELTQQHASHAVAGGTCARSARGARATKGVLTRLHVAKLLRNTKCYQHTVIGAACELVV